MFCAVVIDPNVVNFLKILLEYALCSRRVDRTPCATAHTKRILNLAKSDEQLPFWRQAWPHTDICFSFFSTWKLFFTPRVSATATKWLSWYSYACVDCLNADNSSYNYDKYKHVRNKCCYKSACFEADFFLFVSNQSGTIRWRRVCMENN